MGSIMIEENVVSSAGAHNRFDAEGIRGAIREAGFTPRLRDQLYGMREYARRPETLPGSPGKTQERKKNENALFALPFVFTTNPGTVRLPIADGLRPGHAYSITAAQPPLRTMSIFTTVEASTFRSRFL